MTGANAPGVVTSIPYRASCLILPRHRIGEKFFELGTHFVRLKGGQAVWGSSSTLYLANSCTDGAR